MSQIQAVEIQDRAGKLVELYRKLWAKRFQDAPVLDVSSSMESARFLIIKMGYERSQTLITNYMALEDDWILNQGFSLEWLKGNVNKVLVKTNQQQKVDAIYWVVGFSESLVPVLSKNQWEMGKEYWWKPMLFEEYKTKYPNGIKHEKNADSHDVLF